jgi:hypothetical protein
MRRQPIVQDPSARQPRPGRGAGAGQRPPHSAAAAAGGVATALESKSVLTSEDGDAKASRTALGAPPPTRATRSSGTPGIEMGRRWLKGIAATILTLGALAGAIGAILALRPSPDPEDSAEITAVRPTLQTLHEYEQRWAQGAGHNPSTVPQETLARSDQAEQITGQLSGFGCDANREPRCVGQVAVRSLDRGRHLVPPSDAARDVVKHLKNVRTNKVGEELGVQVMADFKLTGLRGQSVVVSWEILQLLQGGRPGLSGAWLNRTPVSELVPSTDHDTTTVPLWVPLPQPQGPYIIRVHLTLGPSPLASADSPSVD